MDPRLPVPMPGPLAWDRSLPLPQISLEELNHAPYTGPLSTMDPVEMALPPKVACPWCDHGHFNDGEQSACRSKGVN